MVSVGKFLDNYYKFVCFCSFLDAEGVCCGGSPAAQWSALLIKWNLRTDLKKTDFGLALASQGGVKNSSQPQATPQYFHSLQLISDSLAWLRLTTLPRYGQRWKVCIGLNSYMFKITFWSEYVSTSADHTSYYCSMRKCRFAKECVSYMNQVDKVKLCSLFATVALVEIIQKQDLSHRLSLLIILLLQPINLTEMEEK